MITMSGISSGEPVCGNHECCAASVDASDCSMPITMPASAVGNQQLEVADRRGRERGNDGERVRGRRERADRRDQDAGRAGDDRARHPVEQRDPLGRDAAHERADLRLRDGPREQAEPGPPVQRGQRERERPGSRSRGRSDRTAASPIPSATRSRGRSARRSPAPGPTRFSMSPCITTRTPSDATARASGGACRSGRNTTTYSSAPSAAVSTSAMQRRGYEAERSADADCRRAARG